MITSDCDWGSVLWGINKSWYEIARNEDSSWRTWRTTNSENDLAVGACTWCNLNNKAGVINDPLVQPTVPAGSEDLCWSMVKSGDGRTDNMFEYSDHYRPELWSASWINRKLEIRCREWKLETFLFIICCMPSIHCVCFIRAIEIKVFS